MIIVESPLAISFWICLALRMFITWFKAKIGFTIREVEPSQRKGEYTLHNFKFINYQSNRLCFNFHIPWWGTSEIPWSSWILNIAVDKREIFVSNSLFFYAVMALGFEILSGRTLLWTMRMIVMKNGKRHSSLNIFGKSICSFCC